MLTDLQSWDSFFRQTQGGAQPGHAYVRPANLAPPETQRNTLPLGPHGHGVLAPANLGSSRPVSEKDIDDHLGVQAIIRSYQVLA